jgi:uncharacterized protein YjiS (DUF1127 family)
MAWADTTSGFSTGPIIEHRTIEHRTIERRPSLVQTLWERFRSWQAERETVRQLSSLDAATLKDLGISPREIESLVYGGGRDGRRYNADWWRTR